MQALGSCFAYVGSRTTRERNARGDGINVNQTNGRLTPIGWVESHGKTPRFFGFDPAERYLFVANEDSDTIVPFEADDHHGALKPTGDVVHNGSPICIVFATAGSIGGPPGS